MKYRLLYFSVFCGGFIGGIVRLGFERLANASFPLGTFLVNIFGAFLIGIFLAQMWQKSQWHQQVKVFLTTGLCGGMTTFSSFTYDTILLLQQQQYQQALAFLVLDFGVSICAAYFGILVGLRLNWWRTAKDAK